MRRLSIVLTSTLLVLSLQSSSAMAQATVAKSYRIVSVTPSDIVIRIAPVYSTRIVADAVTGKPLTQIHFDGGSNVGGKPGMPEMMSLVLPILTPNRQPVSVTIASQKFEVLPNTDLAPVPSYIQKSEGEEPVYNVDNSLYAATILSNSYEIEPADLFRTAFTEQVIVRPIEYSAATHTVTRLKEMTLHIHLSDFPNTKQTSVSSTERDLFSAAFINGSITSLYRCAASAVGLAVDKANAFKKTNAQSGGQWLQIETTDEGIYRITSQDLANAGISGAIDPATIQLFGVGGEMLEETVTGSNGEWIQRPIEVHTSGSTFTDLYFYTRGQTTWKYAQQSSGSIDGLYHRQNFYSSTGHFLLKVGGESIGTALRVRSGQDTITGAVQSSDRVFTATLHEQERFFEYPNVGRELLGEAIPRADVGPLQISLDAPGYTGDSSTVRVGYDAMVVYKQTGSVSVSMNGENLGSIDSRPLDSYNTIYITRSWDNALHVPSSVSGPLSLNLNFQSSDVAGRAWLDFVEFMYMRTTDIGSSTIPFMLINQSQAFSYTFTNANGGAVWDVTNSKDPRSIAQADGDKIPVTLQGIPSSMRRLIAFSSQSVLIPRISASDEPTLRSGICQTGALEIIIAPQAFLDQANELKSIREQGGQATEPLSVAVVTMEDIVHEFGYGSKDLTAVRDFLAYTFRQTTQNGTTIPIYVTLMGAGHSDYENRVTQIPNWIPAWESPDPEYLGTLRTTVYAPHPDDGFFVRLQPHNSDNQLDMITGRISAHDADESENYVAKVREYELHSAQGEWRSKLTAVADDRIGDDANAQDPLYHLEDTENELAKVPDRLLIDKIYEAKYPTVYTSEGRRKPQVEQAIVDRFNSGTVIFSFIGHGNPNVWTHEAILQVPSTINKLSNFDHLAFVTTATCDFSEYDSYGGDVSGGTQMLLKPDGAAIGLLGTSRSVTGGDPLVDYFYQSLLGVDPSSAYGTNSVGASLMASKLASYSGNIPHYYILGDPAQRLLVPKLYAEFDSINGAPVDGSTPHVLSALSQVRLTGHIARGDDELAPLQSDFNGKATITLYDSKSRQTAVTIIAEDRGMDTINDGWLVEGPILYRGSATVVNGKFSASFIVPKDIKFDSLSAKLSALAYSDDNRCALGATRALSLNGSDSVLSIIDTAGPTLGLFIGNKDFRSGDAVSKHSTVIVDVADQHGLNTSDASVGHGFIAWVDDSSEASVDLAETFVAKQDDFTSGTSTHPIELPAGHHTLHVRAFDTFDNPTFASVEFVAKNESPFALYNVSNYPNPIADHTTFSFVQPGSSGSLAHITLSLYTTDGRLARTLTTETRESSVDIVWDTKDALGNMVANGAYIYHINAQDIDDGTSTQAEGLCIVSR